MIKVTAKMYHTFMNKLCSYEQILTFKTFAGSIFLFLTSSMTVLHQF